MIEALNLAMYPVLGFAVTYLGLELAWHFTACRAEAETLKPCLFKQVKVAVASIRRAN